MTDFQLANPKPDNNRIAGNVAQALEQAEFVRVNADEELVPADVSLGVEGQAAGVAATPVIDPDDPKYGTTDFMQNTLREERSLLVGEDGRAGGFVNDIIVEDQDGEDPLTPGQPVYLAQGSATADGWVTQDPSMLDTGEAVQIIGYAEDTNSFLLQVQFTDETQA